MIPVHTYDLIEIARIGVLFLPGDALENVMPPERREYPLLAWTGSEYGLGDEIDYVEDNFNAVKRTLLLIERIDPRRSAQSAVWIRRPESPDKGEVIVAGGTGPIEGTQIERLRPELERALAGTPTRLWRGWGETVYYPIRNSDEEIVGALEITARHPA